MITKKPAMMDRLGREISVGDWVAVSRKRKYTTSTYLLVGEVKNISGNRIYVSSPNGPGFEEWTPHDSRRICLLRAP